MRILTPLGAAALVAGLAAFAAAQKPPLDHYLKGAHMPVWISKGVPAVDKGRTTGTDLDPRG